MSEHLIVNYTLLPHAPKDQLLRRHDSDAGFDIRSAIDFIVKPVEALTYESETVLFSDGSRHMRRKYERQLIPTGIQLAPENLCFFLLMPRSGFSSDYLMLMRNAIGLIDCEYRGELMISVWALSRTIPIPRGERIAQLVPVKQHPVQLVLSGNLAQSRRGDGGFGSSGL